MMLVSNFLFDLYFFASVVDPESGTLAWFARITAGLFVLLVGISLTLSFQKNREKFWIRNLFRGFKIFALGMAITFITKLAIGQDYVVFGILHLIGVGIIFSYPFLHSKWFSLFFGLTILSLTYVLGPVRVSYPWLVWLGVQYYGFQSVDYTPIVPWFGLMLVGIFLGNVLYPIGKGKFSKPEMANNSFLRLLVFCGQHSLIIYFVHQPLFWAGFYSFRIVGGS